MFIAHVPDAPSPVKGALVESTTVIFAVPSKATPLIVRAVVNLVALAASVALEAVPVRLPSHCRNVQSLRCYLHAPLFQHADNSLFNLW